MVPGLAGWLRRRPASPWPAFHRERFVAASGLRLGLHPRSVRLPGRARGRGRKLHGSHLPLGPARAREAPNNADLDIKERLFFTTGKGQIRGQGSGQESRKPAAPF